MEHLAQVIWKIVPLRPTIHLCHKPIIISLGVIADLPNTQRQAQKWGQRNMLQMKEKKKKRNPQKKNEMKWKQAKN